MALLGGACGDFDLFPNLGERTPWPTVRPAVRLSLWPFSLSDRPGKKNAAKAPPFTDGASPKATMKPRYHLLFLISV